MVAIQVALGGITRLTGSGLSITEWNVVTGTLPPMNEAAWLAEFAKYKATPQFHLLNSDFGLSDFKSIFFWEWFHRFWARLLGVVFFIGFVYFLATRKFREAMIKPFLILFALGGLQGAVGWIMVASGLDGDRHATDYLTRPVKSRVNPWWPSHHAGLPTTPRAEPREPIAPAPAPAPDSCRRGQCAPGVSRAGAADSAATGRATRHRGSRT
eukprot:gene64827-88678_t